VSQRVGQSSLRTRTTIATRLILELPSAFRWRLLHVVLFQVGAAALVIVELQLIRQLGNEHGSARSSGLSDSLLRDIALVLFAHLAARTLASLAGGYRGPLAEQLSTHFALVGADAAATVPYERFAQPDFHDLLSRLQKGQSRVWYVADGLIEGISLIATGTAVVIVLMRVAPAMLLALLAVTIPLLWVARANARDERSRDVELAEIERLRESLDRSLRSSSVAKEVRTLHHGSFLLCEMRRALELRGYHLVKMLHRRQARILIMNVTLLMAAGVGILIMQNTAPDNRPALSTVGVAGVAAYQLFGRIRSLSDISEGIRAGAYVLDDYAAIVDEPRLDEKPGEGTGVQSRIAIQRVGYTYPEASRPAVADVSLSVAAGDFVAIVGDNGSGKSTVAKLLSGLLTPQTGAVHTSANRVSPLFQDFARYELSLKANLLLGSPAPSDYDMVLAETGVAELIEALPYGEDTILSARFAQGVDLSGGQWQRVALARVLLHRKELLVLDEPTAALDALSEDNLLTLISSLRRDHPVVLITHRLATARRAYRIVFLADGHVLGEGPHYELLNSCPDYRERYELQASGYLELVEQTGPSVE
jgi:ATP-binding cassette, subfamily B, bacterial